MVKGKVFDRAEMLRRSKEVFAKDRPRSLVRADLVLDSYREPFLLELDRTDFDFIDIIHLDEVREALSCLSLAGIEYVLPRLLTWALFNVSKAAKSEFFPLFMITLEIQDQDSLEAKFSIEQLRFLNDLMSHLRSHEEFSENVMEGRLIGIF